MVKKVWLTVVGSKRDRGLEKWRMERLAANRDSVGILFVFGECGVAQTLGGYKYTPCCLLLGYV